MSLRRLGGVVAIMTAATVAATGAVAVGSASAAPAGSVRSVGSVTVNRVHVTGGHHVQMRRHLHPGVHEFHVTSRGAAAFQVVHPRPGYTARMFAHDVNKGLNGGKVRWLKRFERNTVLVGGVAAAHGQPGVVTLRLPRGRFWALDTNTHRLTRSLVTRGSTYGRYHSGRITGDSSIAALGDVDWSAKPTSIAPEGTLRFVNRSSDNHFAELAKIADGKTYADFVSWIEAAKSGSEGGPPPIDEDVSLVTGVVSPHHVMNQRYSLPAGDYVLICWWPDAEMGGMPHALMGMYRELHVAVPTT